MDKWRVRVVEGHTRSTQGHTGGGGGRSLSSESVSCRKRGVELTHTHALVAQQITVSWVSLHTRIDDQSARKVVFIAALYNSGITSKTSADAKAIVRLFSEKQKRKARATSMPSNRAWTQFTSSPMRRRWVKVREMDLESGCKGLWRVMVMRKRRKTLKKEYWNDRNIGWQKEQQCCPSDEASCAKCTVSTS